ncbi:hypothetical protein EV714DRAFT_168191, partial [Schizophyllum commune]
SSKLEQICRWLQYPDCSVKMNRLLDDRAQSTGSWFLDCWSFTAFKEGTERAVLLRGKAGCGKSTVMSYAARNLRLLGAYPETESAAITVVHLFDVTDQSHGRDLRALISSLLCQLALVREGAQATLYDSFKSHMHGQQQPSQEDLRQLLHHILSKITGRIFVVVDALDEADDTHEKLLPFLEEQVSQHPMLSLLVSSRREVPFFDRLAKLCPVHTVMHEKRVSGDIDKMLGHHFRPGGMLAGVTNGEKVQERLRDGADGNFHWAVLQMRRIAKVASLSDTVLERLTGIPSTIGQLYNDCLEAIEPEDRAKVHHLLVWLVFSGKPLSVPDFTRLLSIVYPDDQPPFASQSNPGSVYHVLGLVGSTFVTVTARPGGTDGGVVQLGHASVKDYLIGLRGSAFSMDWEIAANLFARTAIACLA